jgi:putative lipoic acid-binding regulatory protein
MKEESLLSFPCEFPIKVMGRSSETFEAEVVGIVRKHAPDLSEDAVTSRASGKGNYIAVTVIVTATSKEQLDNIYLELNAHEDVMMTL